MSSRSRRGPIIVIATVAIVLTLGFVGYFGGRALWNRASDALAGDHCTVGTYDLGTDQASVAATMAGAVTGFRPALPERAAVLVLAAGLQESKLTNLSPGAGDRDSVGVLQQRPSQGWGSPPGDAASLNDVHEATVEFLRHLVRVPGWQQMTLADAVQAVQISADGSAYAKHEPEAQQLADALGGHVPRGITCAFGAPTAVASAGTVARLVAADLPVNPPLTSPRTVRVPGAGWQTSAWFVANADRLGIGQVAYAGWSWTRADGWARDGQASPASVVATLAKPT